MFFSLATPAMARPQAEFTPSTIMSTPSRSHHSRAMLAAMSALFWWSAEMTSTCKALPPPMPISSSACFTAATAPGPDTSR